MTRQTSSIALCLALFAGQALADAATDVQVLAPYARQVPPGAVASAAFMTLKNQGVEDHALVQAASPAAEVVALHEHVHRNGMMEMRRVPRIGIPAGGVTRLQPGGYHVMLIRLRGDLVPGQEVPLTLTFEDGSRKRVTAQVRRIGAMMRPAD